MERRSAEIRGVRGRMEIKQLVLQTSSPGSFIRLRCQGSAVKSRKLDHTVHCRR